MHSTHYSAKRRILGCVKLPRRTEGARTWDHATESKNVLLNIVPKHNSLFIRLVRRRRRYCLRRSGGDIWSCKWQNSRHLRRFRRLCRLPAILTQYDGDRDGIQRRRQIWQLEFAIELFANDRAIVSEEGTVIRILVLFNGKFTFVDQRSCLGHRHCS